MTPDLSVIVPSVNGWENLGECLATLREAGRALPLELIVVDRLGPAVTTRVAAAFPEVVILSAARHETIPDLRARGIARATAPLVAIIEDHVLVPPDWARTIVDAQRAHGGVVAGSVENAATDRVTDLAAFYCEYSHLLGPLEAGRTSRLTGNNTVYPRAVLLAHRALVDAGRWEDFVHRGLEQAGVPLTCCPEVVVAHKKHYTIGEYAAQRFWYARAFAGDRVSGRAWPVRALYSLGAIGLPPLLWGRTIGRTWRSREPRPRLLCAVPLISLFVCAWGLGEAVGYSLGAGDALARVC